MSLSFSKEAVRFNRERMTDIQQATRAICEAAAVGDTHTVNLLSDKIGILASGADRDLEQWGKEIKSGDCLETLIGVNGAKDRAEAAIASTAYNHEKYQASSTKDRVDMMEREQILCIGPEGDAFYLEEPCHAD